MGKIRCLICLFFVTVCMQLQATHIVGGELYYDFLGTEDDGRNIYRITLKIFRDCGPNTANFDGVGPGNSPAFITVLDADGNSEGRHNIGYPLISKVPPSINSPCMNVPNNICVEEGVYTYTLLLAPKMGGHYIVYQRCCRNHSIVNLTTPGAQGTTYYAFIPGPETAPVNSSPRFSDYPPIFLCVGFDFSYAQAATEPVGDQLVYKFSAPFQGLDVCCPAIGAVPSNCANQPPSCPQVAVAPPYPTVNYAAGYSAANPAPANPPFAINAMSGAMSGAPTMVGQYVISVCVEEYRDGQLISKHFRDFQFNMLPCQGVVSQFKNQEKCQGTDFKFQNTSFNASSFYWDFGVPDSDSDTSNLEHPAFVFPDTGQYLVKLIVNRGGDCSDTAEKMVRVYPPLDISFEPPGVQCLLGNSFSFKTLGSYAGSTDFFWTFNAAATPSATTSRDVEKVVFSEPGTYFVQLRAKHFVCTDEWLDTLKILPMPVVEIQGPGPLCEPATARLSNKLEDDGDLSVVWQTNAGKTSTLSAPEFTALKAGTYTVQMIGTLFNMCRDTSYYSFVVNKPPVSLFDVYPETVTILEPEVNIKSQVKDAVQHFYVFSDGGNADFVSGKYSFYSEGVYQITQYVTNFFGCVDSSSKIINVLPEHRFWMPNVFTPDGNGLNDTFGPHLIGVSQYVFEVFDRWGEQLFYSADPFLGWNGEYKGKKCPEGVYTYRLMFKNAVDGTPVLRHGHVTLLRSE